VGFWVLVEPGPTAFYDVFDGFGGQRVVESKGDEVGTAILPPVWKIDPSPGNFGVAIEESEQVEGRGARELRWDSCDLGSGLEAARRDLTFACVGELLGGAMSYGHSGAKE